MTVLSTNNNPTLRVIRIVEGTSVDGPGLRTSIYFAGCRHQCPGCHNPQTWDFEAGYDMTVDELVEAVKVNGFNVTFTGGDPLYQLPTLILLAKRIRQEGFTIWCYTGFTFEELSDMEGFKDLLPFLEAIVDGPFKIEERDISLPFRGSRNQRIIRLSK